MLTTLNRLSNKGRPDGILSESFPTVRLRTKQCGEPNYAAPLQLRAVAEADLADRAYLGRPGYDATKVYRGHVRKTFSHFARVLAGNPLTPFRLDYFARFYAPSTASSTITSFWKGRG